MLRKLKKAVKPLMDKAAKSGVGRQVMKVPAPIRKGWAAGMMVPVPGGGTAGASVGAGVWAKDKIERGVAGKLGQPYRLFETNFEEGLSPGIYRGARPVRALPIFNHEYTVVVPKHPDRLDKATRRKMRKVGGRMALVSGAYKDGGRLKSKLGDKVDVAAAKSGFAGLKRESATGSTRATRDAVKVSKAFKGEKYPGFFRNVIGAGKNSNSYARSVVEKLTKKKSENVFRRTPGGDLRVELETDFMKTTTPAEAILGDSFFKGIAERSGLTRHIEFRENEEDEIARDRRTLRKIAIGTGVAGLAAGLVIRKGRGGVTPFKFDPKLPAAAKVKVHKRALKLRKKGTITPLEAQDLEAAGYTPMGTPMGMMYFKERDNLSKVRDAAIIGGTGAVGVGALLAGREAVKTGKSVREAVTRGGALLDRTAKRVRVEMTPQAVLQEGKKAIKDSVKKRVKKSFPTFIKVARKMGLEENAPLRKRFERGDYLKKTHPHASGVIDKWAKAPKKTGGRMVGDLPDLVHSMRQMKSDGWTRESGLLGKKGMRKVAWKLRKRFETPADRIIEFGTDGQLKTRRGTFASPLGVATGTQTGYHSDELTRVRAAAKAHGSNHPSARPRGVDLPVGDMQVIRSAHRVAKGVNKHGSRAVAIARDAKDVVTGKPRERDASGRKKKREWEKSWAKNAAKNVAITAGVLGYATGMRKSPRFRAANMRGAKAVKGAVNKYIPNSFSTPAEMLGVTFLAEKREGVSDKVKVGVAGAMLGGTTGALYGAVPGAGGKEAQEYLTRRTKVPKLKEEAFRKGRLGYREKRSRRILIANAQKMSVAKKGMLGKMGRGAAKGGLVGAAALGGLGYAMSPKDDKKRFEVIAARLTELARIPVNARTLGASKYIGKLTPGADWVKQIGSVRVSDKKTAEAIGKQGRRMREKISASSYRKAGNDLPGINDTDYNNRLRRELKRNRKRIVISDAAADYGTKKLPKPNLDLDFATPAEAMGVIELDDNAAAAGWDVRDPRGRSARVFAPGSRRRVRRGKEWHEEIGNERKLWAAGVAGAAVAGGAAGVALNRPKKPKAVPVPVKPAVRPKIVPISSGAKTPAAKKLYRKAANFLKKTV